MMTTRIKTLLLVSGLLGSLALNAQDSNPATAAVKPYPGRLAWWGDARFGMFIHWDPISLKGTEIGWSRAGQRRGYGRPGTEVPVEVYDNLYKRFNPTNFNADQWVAVAKAAGMKYLVYTSRHHDGFSMFDTKASDYKITSPDSPFRRDVVKELADACHRAGLRFGLYYSQPNWRDPDAFTERHTNYLAFLKGQVSELLTNYGKVDIIWFDGLGKSAQDYDAVNLNGLVHKLQPQTLINDRDGLPEDFDTPEQRIGKFQIDRPWETCMTICQQWAWKPDDRMKSLQQCLNTLIRCAGGDGNLLFNVGPMPDGRIEPRQVERLNEMGAWLANHGETVYGTRGGPWKPGTRMASTRKGNTVFVHLLGKSDEILKLPNLSRKIISSSLSTGGTVDVKQTADGITIEIPDADWREIDTIVKLDLDGPALDIAPISLTSVGKTAGKATASNVYHNDQSYSADKAFDGDPETRWATDNGTRQAWLEVELDKPATFSRVTIDEWAGGGRRVQSFELQYQDGNEWKTFHKGTIIGANWATTFQPLTAQRLRLNILDATEGPTINEMQFFNK